MLSDLNPGPRHHRRPSKTGELMSHHRKHNRDDKRERWDFQPDWREERDSDDDELPEREDDPPPANTFHISRH